MLERFSASRLPDVFSDPAVPSVTRNDLVYIVVALVVVLYSERILNSLRIPFKQDRFHHHTRIAQKGWCRTSCTSYIIKQYPEPPTSRLSPR